MFNGLSHERDAGDEDSESCLSAARTPQRRVVLVASLRQSLIRSRFGVDEKGVKTAQKSSISGGFFRCESR
jgi:hypothetical protein